MSLLYLSIGIFCCLVLNWYSSIVLSLRFCRCRRFQKPQYLLDCYCTSLQDLLSNLYYSYSIFFGSCVRNCCINYGSNCCSWCELNCISIYSFFLSSLHSESNQALVGICFMELLFLLMLTFFKMSEDAVVISSCMRLHI